MNHTLTLLIVIVSVSVSALSVSYLPNERTPPPTQQRASLTFDSKSNMLYFYGGISIETRAISGDLILTHASGLN